MPESNPYDTPKKQPLIKKTFAPLTSPSAVLVTPPPKMTVKNTTGKTPVANETNVAPPTPPPPSPHNGGRRRRTNKRKSKKRSTRRRR